MASVSDQLPVTYSFKIMKYLILICLLSAYLFIVFSCSDKRLAETIKRNEEAKASLEDMNIPPVLSDRMKDPSWNIRYWLGVDTMGDCQTAHEYMDDGVVEKTTRSRRGGTGRTHNIFEYLGSCKRAAQRAFDLVSPNVKKWCHYRQTDARFNELCTEWEKNGESYISTIQAHYISTEARFRQMTGGAYDEKLKNL